MERFAICDDGLNLGREIYRKKSLFSLTNQILFLTGFIFIDPNVRFDDLHVA